MNVVCIGAGRLAHHLMPVLQKHDHNILQIYNRSEESGKSLAAKLHADYVSRLDEVNTTADIYFFTLSDDAIAQVAEKLNKEHFLQGICVHSSGVLGLDVLPFENRGIFYPLQTFSDDHEIDWSNTPILITSENETVSAQLKNIASSISSNVYEISEQQKPLLHIAAVVANNFTNHMLHLAESICKENNIPFDILRPLIRTTFEKALDNGPAESQTGPAIRGDEASIMRHIQLLQNHPQVLEVYRAITKSLQSTKD